MRIFLSWSGERSKQLALLLQQWLPRVLQVAEPWTSDDIGKGSLWSSQILEQLNRSPIGIVCLTPESLDSKWLYFEAGALARTPGQIRVCTFLFPGMSPRDVPSPLDQFEATSAERSDVRRLLSTLNSALGEQAGKSLSDRLIDDAFRRAWPDFDRRLKRLTVLEPVPSGKRSRLGQFADEINKELTQAGFDAFKVVGGGSLAEAPLEVQLNVRRLLGELSGGLEQLSRAERLKVYGGSDQHALFEMARAMVAEHRWVEAARYLDEYVEVNPRDWRAHKWRGIAHAMSRQGHAANVAALDAYRQAIATLPRHAPRGTKALLFNYRGAMYKRLDRHREALVDLDKARKLADDDLLLRDIRYNLACVYALTGKRAQAIAEVRQLRGARREMDLIRRHLTDYFQSLAADREFVSLLASDRVSDDKAERPSPKPRRPTSR